MAVRSEALASNNLGDGLGDRGSAIAQQDQEDPWVDRQVVRGAPVSVAEISLFVGQRAGIGGVLGGLSGCHRARPLPNYS